MANVRTMNACFGSGAFSVPRLVRWRVYALIRPLETAGRRRIEGIQAAPACSFGLQPALFGQPEHAGAYQPVADAERRQQFDQAAEPDFAAMRRNRVTE